MDVLYFLKNRTEFIRFYYEAAVKPFGEIRNAIEQEQPPFDNPPYSEDPEPPFLEEWMDAATAEQIVGLSCVALLSDSLKIYFNTLQRRVIGFSFAEKSAYRNGFLAAYLGALGEILETDWSDCDADLAVVEQVVLARNRGLHGEDLTTFDVTHDGHTLEKHPTPFFASEEELRDFPRVEGALSWFIQPTLRVTRDKLFTAIEEVEKLADYIERRSEKMWEWRTKSRGEGQAEDA